MPRPVLLPLLLLLLLPPPTLSTPPNTSNTLPSQIRQDTRVRVRCPCACTNNFAVIRNTCARTPVSNCRVSRCSPRSNGFSCCARGQSPPQFRFPRPRRPELQDVNTRRITDNGRNARAQEPERSQELADLLLEAANRIGELIDDDDTDRMLLEGVMRQSGGAFAQFASASQETLLFVYSNLILH